MKALLLSMFFTLPTMATVPPAGAELTSPDKKISGKIQIIPDGEKVRIVSEVRGLKPNSEHGFHIHENGKCDGPTYESAGAHYNPEKQPHGPPDSVRKHLGDLGNLKSDSKGIAKSEVVLEGLKEQEIRDLFNRAVVVHAKVDDLKTQPSGDSGDRIACGLIKTSK